MRIATLILTAIAIASSSSALPAAGTSHDVAVDPVSVPAPVPVPASAPAPSSPVQLRQTSRRAILARAVAKVERARRKRDEGGAAEPQASAAVCPGSRWAVIEGTLWQSMSSYRSLARHVNRERNWRTDECAVLCNNTAECNYAYTYSYPSSSLCELIRVTDLVLTAEEGFSSILPGSCTQNRLTYGITAQTACTDLCIDGDSVTVVGQS